MTTCPGCLIDSICYGDGQTDPLEICRWCDPEMSTTAWSDNDGALCDDGAFCTVDDVCEAGVCSGTARDCADGITCNESCDEAADACVHDLVQCPLGTVCYEAGDLCCTPNVVASELECNEDGDVVGTDTCDSEIVVDDCHDTRATCEAGACVCLNGMGGPECDCVFSCRHRNDSRT